jgi:hypothetical protein
MEQARSFFARAFGVRTRPRVALSTKMVQLQWGLNDQIRSL